MDIGARAQGIWRSGAACVTRTRDPIIQKDGWAPVIGFDFANAARRVLCAKH